MNLPQVYMCSPSWTLLPPPSPYHTSGSSHCTSPKHPVLCIKPGLATRFIHYIIHVSMPFSQIIPPSPSPTESKRLFFERNAGVGGSRSWSARRSASCFEFSYPEGGEAGRRGRRGPRDPASEQKLFVLRNRQLSGSRDGGGSRAAVAAQLAGKPGWDKGRAGRGWHGAAAFAAEDGTGVLGPLSEWRPEPGAREARELWRDWGWSQRARSSAWCRTGGTGDRCGGGVVAWGVREWVPPGKSGDSGTDAETARSSEPREWT